MGLAAVDDDSSRGIVGRQTNGDFVTEDHADAMLAELTAKVGKHLVSVLEFDAKIAGGQHLDDSALKLYMLFATHKRPDATRSVSPGQ